MSARSTLRRRGLTVLVIGCVGLLAAFRPATVVDGEMAPSLLMGEWIVLGPGTPEFGDVVLLDDPTEPGRRVLRRVVALDGEPIQVRGGLVDQGRYREMNRDEERVVFSEADHHLVQTRVRVVEEPAVGDAAAGLFVLADDRDRGIDSRWWGRVPAGSVRGVVWLRLGGADVWRGPVGWFAADGPWTPRSKQPAG